MTVAVRTGSAVDLGAEVLAGLGSVARDLLGRAADRVDDPAWVCQARRAWHETPAELRHVVREFRRFSGPFGVVVLRGIPIDAAAVPATPTVRGSAQQAPALPAAVLLLLASGLGDPVAFAEEKAGALVQDVVPCPGEEEVQGNTGSAELTFHTENAFHPHRPDFVLLLCLRADHDGVAELRTACIRRMIAELPDQAREALSRPEFVTVAPPSFAGAGEDMVHAVLSGGPDDPDLRADEAATRPLTRAGRAALAELSAAVRRNYQGIRLRPGELAIVDNRVAMHGRSAFGPRYDGGDRWLQRTFVAADLRRSRDMRPGDGHVLG